MRHGLMLFTVTIQLFLSHPSYSMQLLVYLSRQTTKKKKIIVILLTIPITKSKVSTVCVTL